MEINFKEVYFTCVTLIALFLCGILASLFLKNPIQGFAEIFENPWGWVVLVDLYFGILFVGGWIYFIEEEKSDAYKWWVGLFLFGNLTTVAYIMMRAKKNSGFHNLFLPKKYEIVATEEEETPRRLIGSLQDTRDKP